MTDKRPFKNIKVLEISRVLAGPFASGQLALLGAQVIKIEDPGVGDADQQKDHAARQFLGARRNAEP